MNRNQWAAAFLASVLGLGMLTGCSKKENTNEEQGTSPSSEVKPARNGCQCKRHSLL